MKKFLFSLMASAIGTALSAQTFLWSTSFGGAASGDEYAMNIYTDSDGSVYSAGLFAGTTDFDPGPGVFNLYSSGLANICVTKQDADGNLVWAKAMTGIEYSTAKGVVVDGDKNVYVTGWFTGEVDFDPGPGLMLIDEGSTVWRDVFVLKLDSAGNLDWVRTFGAGHEDGGWDIALDPSGNLIVTGVFADAVDFDPGAGTTTLTAVNKDVFILKLDASGNLIWAKSNTTAVSSSSDDQPYGVCTDASGNIFVTGFFGSQCDFDPGAGTTYLTDPAGFDGFIQKLDASGNLLWVRQLASTSIATGWYMQATPSGGVIIPGFFQGTLDSDPGAAVANVDPVGMQDAFVMELDASGNLVWFEQMGSIGNDAANSVVLESSGDIWVGGRFTDTLDFDPGAGTASLISMGGSDGYIQHLSSSGTHLGVWQIGGTTDDAVIRLRRNGTEFTACGYFTGTADLNPLAGVSSHTAGGGSDAFTLRLNSIFIGTDEASHGTEVTVWPNPTSSALWVKADEAVDVLLMNAAGQLLIHSQAEADLPLHLDMSALAAGVYVLQVSSASGTATQKIVRQ